MAVKQTEDRRIREAINKRINRQIAQDWQPLTKYKSYFPVMGEADIIDRRTGLVKEKQRFVREYVKHATERAARGGGASVPGASAAYANAARQMYSNLLQILKDSQITQTKNVVSHWYRITEEVMARYTVWLAEKIGRTDPERYREIMDKLEDMGKSGQLALVREAGHDANASKHTISFYGTLSEMLGIENIETDTP